MSVRRHDQIMVGLTPVAGPSLLVIAVVAIVAGVGDAGLNRIATLGLVNLILVVGLYTFVGNSGILSFGQMSFMAVGAYISGALTIPLTMRNVLLPNLPGPLGTELLPTVPAIVLGAAVAAVVAFVVAIPLMQLSGLAAGIASLAVLQITYVVASNWNDMTGGAASMPGVPRTTGLWSTLVWALAAIAVAYLFQISRFGLRLRAAREDQGAAASIGVNVVWHRVFAFCLSAFIVGAGGGLHIHFLGIGSPESFYLGITFMTLAMLVVGGMNSLWGAVIGTLVVTTIGELLLRIELASGVLNLREVGLALVMLAILILRPRGITGGLELEWYRVRDCRGVATHERAAGRVSPHEAGEALMSTRHRVAVDVGGTFTDLVAVDADGNFRFTKVPTTYPDFQRGVVDAVRAGDVSFEDMEIFLHGLTIATNAVVARAGAQERVSSAPRGFAISSRSGGPTAPAKACTTYRGSRRHHWCRDGIASPSANGSIISATS